METIARPSVVCVKTSLLFLYFPLLHVSASPMRIDLVVDSRIAARGRPPHWWCLPRTRGRPVGLSKLQVSTGIVGGIWIRDVGNDVEQWTHE